MSWSRMEEIFQVCSRSETPRADTRIDNFLLRGVISAVEGPAESAASGKPSVHHFLFFHIVIDGKNIFS